MRGFPASPVLYVGPGLVPAQAIDVHDLFNAMADDLIHDGDIDLAMQKAFRWGFRDEDGASSPGLRDLIQRLREDREHLLDQSAQLDDAMPDEIGQPAKPDPADHEEATQMAGKLEEMERSLRAIENIDELRELDPDLIAGVLTDQERQWLDQWANMQGLLEAEGLVIEVGDRLELTPAAVRRIGEQALRAIFASVDPGRDGNHETRIRGRGDISFESSVPWQFGDPFNVNLSRTLMNSIARSRPNTRLRLIPGDFEVYEREDRGSTATVLLIDMSRSMFYNGCWDAAKRAAIALDTLMRRRFYRDDLEIVGFSDLAIRLSLNQLPSLEWNAYGHGTNLEDGLRLARELLRLHRGKTRQIVVITDGEPTAWLDNGQARFEHPPTRNVFEATMREVVRCTRESIVINTFLLGSSREMSEFAESYSRINRGRLLHADPEHLGRHLVQDFVTHRTQTIH